MKTIKPSGLDSPAKKYWSRKVLTQTSFREKIRRTSFLRVIYLRAIGYKYTYFINKKGKKNTITWAMASSKMFLHDLVITTGGKS